MASVPWAVKLITHTIPTTGQPDRVAALAHPLPHPLLNSVSEPTPAVRCAVLLPRMALSDSGPLTDFSAALASSRMPESRYRRTDGAKRLRYRGRAWCDGRHRSGRCGDDEERGQGRDRLHKVPESRSA